MKGSTSLYTIPQSIKDGVQYLPTGNEYVSLPVGGILAPLIQGERNGVRWQVRVFAPGSRIRTVLAAAESIVRIRA